MSVSAAEPGAEPEVVFTHDGILGTITLNRPRAMNSLTVGMVDAIAEKLTDWQSDPTVETILITGAGERGLCAGGDVVSLYRAIKESPDDAASFWAREYALNLQIAEYPKPYVALMDGVVLGGGVGVAAHGSVRVVTERTRIGMPEVGIGFVPDVGGTWLLSRAPGELGTHMGLTGGSFSGADAIVAGLADHYVESERLAEFAEALTSMPVFDALLRFASDPPESPLAASAAWINECYSSDDASDILSRLSTSTNVLAREAADLIRTRSPLAVSVTLEALHRARTAATLAQVLDEEYRVSLRFAAGREMAEGIRAQVIDKDRTPRWSPADLDGVRRQEIDDYFAPLERRELGLSGPTDRNEHIGSAP